MPDNQRFPFSVTFQYVLIRLALTDDSFYTQASRWFKASFFDSEDLWWFFERCHKYYEKYNRLPSRIFFDNELELVKNEDEKTRLLEVHKKIRTIKKDDDEYIRKHIQAFIQRNIYVDCYDKMHDIYHQQDLEDARSYVEKQMHEMEEVNFNENKYLSTRDTLSILQDQESEVGKKAPIGLNAVDESLNGGPGTGEIFVVLAKDGVGKSTFLVTTTVNAIKQGKKVLYIHSEGNWKTPIRRLCSCYTGILYSKLSKNDITNQETEAIADYQDKTGDQIVIIPYIDKTIEDFKSLVDTVKKTFDFDMIVIDYADKLGTTKKIEREYLVFKEVWQGLESIAFKYEVPIITASQSVRVKGDGNKALRKEEFSESMYKSRLSSYVLSMNRSIGDKRVNEVRYWLDKGRESEDGILIVAESDFSRSRAFLPTNQRAIFQNRNRDDDIDKEGQGEDLGF